MKKTKLIVKKEICDNWISYKTCITIPRIFYKIVEKYYKLKGYEVEELENE